MSIEKLTAAVYDATGTTLIHSFSEMHNGEYRDEMSQRGNGKLHIPLDDAEEAVYDRIVKFSWRGAVRFGCIINNDACDLAVNGRQWLELDNLPGLLALLDQAVLRPEYGLRRVSADQRNFGFMSEDGPWRIPAEWGTPVALRWSDMTGRRTNSPPELRSANPYWISDQDVTLTRDAGTVLYFRAELTLPHYMDVNLIFTADNFLDFYLDGEKIIAKDPTKPNGWHNATTVTKSLAGGVHVLAARVENAGPDVAPNPLGFIGIVQRISVDGAPVETLLETNDTDWTVCTATPGWHKGQVILKALEEAQARDVPGALALTPTFTYTHDSSGEAWGDPVGEFAFDVETTTVADLIVTLCEAGINAHVDPAGMTLDVFNRMGSDKYGTVEYKLPKDGGSLLTYRTAGVWTRATSVTAHLEDDTWEEIDDTAGTATFGRREVGYALGTAGNATTARKFGSEQLAETAQPQRQFTLKASTKRGPQFYDDVDLGDSAKAPAHRGAGTTKLRHLAVTVSQNGQRVDVVSDVMEDLS